MSQPPERPEAGHQHLRRALESLAAHTPADTLWQRIEAQLNVEEAVDRAIARLPAHEPDEDLWIAITTRLDDVGTPAPVAPPLTVEGKRRSWQGWALVAGMAAMLVLALGWWQLAGPAVSTEPRTSLSYHEERLPALPQSPLPDPLDQQGVAFVDAHCTALPTVCQSDEFRELRAQLAHLEAEEHRLQQEAKRLGESPEVVRQQVRVTTQKATITRELIQLLIS